MHATISKTSEALSAFRFLPADVNALELQCATTFSPPTITSDSYLSMIRAMEAVGPFIYDAHIPRTVFGSDTLPKLAEEVDRLGLKRVLVLTTPRQHDWAGRLAEILGIKWAGSFDGATMHTPIAVTDRALEAVGRVKADCVVAIGGGSTIGLGKAITYRTGLSLIVIPTTYAGSEATPILGQTVDRRKTTLTDTRVLPRCIIYDVTLTTSLPWSITVVSGVNALAHCVEALYSVSVNPIITAVAAQGISGITKALIALRMDADDLRARGQALTAAWSAGICLGAVGMGIHHKLCHTLGGSFGLPHAETHTVILPHAMAYNADHARDAMEVVRTAMDAKVPAPLAVWELERGLGTVLTLKQIGMKEEDIEKAADLAMLQTYPNPAPLERSRLVELLRRAFHGLPPA